MGRRPPRRWRSRRAGEGTPFRLTLLREATRSRASVDGDAFGKTTRKFGPPGEAHVSRSAEPRLYAGGGAGRADDRGDRFGRIDGRGSGTARTSGYLRDKTLAQWIALNRLSEVRLNVSKLSAEHGYGRTQVRQPHVALRHALLRHQQFQHETHRGARLGGRRENQGKSAGGVHRLLRQRIGIPGNSNATDWTQGNTAASANCTPTGTGSGAGVPSNPGTGTANCVPTTTAAPTPNVLPTTTTTQ